MDKHPPDNIHSDLRITMPPPAGREIISSLIDTFEIHSPRSFFLRRINRYKPYDPFTTCGKRYFLRCNDKMSSVRHVGIDFILFACSGIRYFL